jgi:hypothetical protein
MGFGFGYLVFDKQFSVYDVWEEAECTWSYCGGCELCIIA